MRKLATIRKIDDINPIEGADFIEVATVGGWKVVIRTGEFDVGDLAVYFEIDSWIPHELAPFLSNGREPREYNGVKGERLRTVKRRGQISQGLLIHAEREWTYNEGHDVSKILNIQKYEPPIPAQLAGQVRGVFPSAVPKTDQERVQNLSAELPTLTDHEFEVTEKLDGSSCTFFLDAEDDFHVCSRNLDLKEDDTNSLWKVAKQYDIKDRMIAMGLRNFAIQGELIGEGIQGNPYKIKGQDFFVFDMYDATSGVYVTSRGRLDLAKKLELKHVPVLDIQVDLDVEKLLTIAENKSILNPGTEREGLVFKSKTDPNVHFKAISNKFLLKTGG